MADGSRGPGGPAGDLPPDLPGRPPLPGVPDPDEPDFYIVDGLYVASRSGLLRRGYCCGAGCRHCPWRRNPWQLKDERDGF